MKGTGYIVSSKRSGTYVMSTDAAELSVYTSPHFTDFERRIFIDNLSIKSVEFSAGENAQIFCRCLIHDTSKPTDSQPLPSGIKLGSETILCLHGFERLTTSWVWIKFAATLFRQGFNVILMDSPGFGKSSIARDIRCPLRAWKGWDAQLVTMFLAKLSISRVNVMACYEGASTFLNLLLDSAIILGKNHYLHNVSESSSLSMTKALLTTGQKRRILTSFDRTMYVDPVNSAASSLSNDHIQALVVAERFMRQVSLSVGFNPISICAVTAAELSEAVLYDAQGQPGTLELIALYPCKFFRIYVAQFLAGAVMQPYSVYQESMGSQSSDIPLTVVSKFSASPASFSYGVRLRQMEDSMVTDLALKQSEQEFMLKHGEDALLHQQALAESLKTKHESAIFAKLVPPKDSAQHSKYIGRLLLQQDEIHNGGAEKEAISSPGISKHE